MANSIPSEILWQCMSNVHNEKVLVKLSDRNKIKQMVNLQQNIPLPFIPRNLFKVKQPVA